MKKLMKLVLSALIAVSLATSVHAQDNDKTSFSVAFNTDAFFGFNVLAGAGIPLSDSLSLDFYGLFWTTNGFTTGNTATGGGGGAPWTEFGGGVTLTPVEALSVSLYVGVLSGNLQSQNGRATLGEAIVPNLTVAYNDGMFEANVYAGFYKTMFAGADHRGTVNDFLHYWTSAGYVINKNFSVGVHWEQLINTAYPTGSTSAGTWNTNYSWIGPYLSVNLPDNNASLSFAGGLDVLGPTTQEHFYKMSIGLNF